MPSAAAAAPAQAAATPVLQPFGFALQPDALLRHATPTNISSSSSSSCCQAQAGASGFTAATAMSSPSASALRQQQDGRGFSPVAAAAAQPGTCSSYSSYDELIRASSNPAALLGRLLENAPNLAREPSSSRMGSQIIGAASLAASAPSSPARVTPHSPAKPPSRFFRPVSSAPQKQQQVQQQQDEVDQQQEAHLAVVVQGEEAAEPSSSSAAAAAGGVGAGAAAAATAAGEAADSESFKFLIEGMSCGSCVASVEASVAQVGMGCVWFCFVGRYWVAMLQDHHQGMFGL